MLIRDKRSVFCVITVLALAAPPRGRGADLALHVVPTPITSYRLLMMSRDDDGYVWAGSIHNAIHRYDPRAGRVETVSLPYKAVACACLCAGTKVYVLGQTYPRLIIYDRAAKTFAEKPYPSAKPDVWYGTELINGRSLYFFDKGSAGVIKWDTASDTGRAVPYPFKKPVPGGGHFEPRDGAIYGRSWERAGGKDVFHGLARLDTATDTYTDFFDFPEKREGLQPFTDPATTFFVPEWLTGKVIPFDFKEKRWCRPLDVPGYGRQFGFLGGPWSHRGNYYFSVSTYNGTDVGCDGKPFHFLNGVLEFDPKRRRFEILTLEAKDAYYQISYMLSAGGEFFATGTNIRTPDGKLDGGRAGEVVFWQTPRVK